MGAAGSRARRFEPVPACHPRSVYPAAAAARVQPRAGATSQAGPLVPQLTSPWARGTSALAHQPVLGGKKTNELNLRWLDT